MLKQLPFPEKLRHVAEHAAAHHEKLDGSGYPFRLEARDTSPQARIIAIADTFEALTYRDRPYKSDAGEPGPQDHGGHEKRGPYRSGYL